uniref:CMP-N-acetylneuraminate-beta-galactosamide-alpha-2,3-sialyltransferase 2 n=1 Tax=Sinocyclocheilus anshuiensis TaxID=1608454 RepID=A0A671M400_9TELE
MPPVNFRWVFYNDSLQFMSNILTLLKETFYSTKNHTLKVPKSFYRPQHFNFIYTNQLSYLDGLRTMSLLCKSFLTRPFSLMLILSFQISVQGLQPSMFRVNYTKVVDQMFSLFPDEDHYSDAGPDRCRTCAVVGNSANLLGSHYGSLIDFHDVVIRINKGPTKGYERDVGSKTTHRILYPESAMDLDNSTHLVLFPFKIRDMQWLISTFTTRHITRTYTRVKPSIKADENKVMVLHPAFIKYVYEKWLLKHGRYPSTGFITIIFALHICDQVNVFGFGASSTGTWHHYFDKTRTHFKGGPHGGDFENKTMHQLQQRNKISVYKGYR